MHEASIVAAIGEVLVQEGMEESEEEDYTVHARSMKQSALDVLAAIELDNYDNAANAVAAITKSCADCHADWR